MADPAAGTIYDIGYQRYEGVRLGRRHAIWALYVHSLRSVFGIGRSLSSKVGPMGLGVIAFLPAVIQVGVAAIAPADVEITRPEEYYELIEIVLAVFCAVVAPELVGRDQRTHTLSLYFSRALRRQDYAIAKFGALTTGMLAITAAPQLMMFVGNGLAADNFFDYLQDEWTDLPSILGSAVMLSSLVAGIGLVIAAQVPGRAYSTVGIIAAFVLTSIIAGSVFEVADKDVGRYALLLSPFHLARGLSLWFFSAFPGGNEELADADLAAVTFAISAALVSIGMLLLLLRRYQRISP
ncbi:MAG TPA: hypothetical protein VIW01_07115 [Dehalococcoidia bacterium]